MEPTHLIIGCGYLGRRVAQRWLSQGKQVAALTRAKSSELQSLGIVPIVGDVLSPATLRGLPAVQTILYAVGLDRSAGRSFREVYVDGLRNILEIVPPPQQFIYISSTSVYGQTDGEVVDENSPTEPQADNGKIVLEAEQTLRQRLPNSTILRCAGIYGPNRVIRRAAIERGEPLVGDAEHWLNLIHVEDGANAVLAAEAQAPTGETYLVADDEPMRRRAFYTFLAQLLNAPAAKFQPGPEGPQEPNRRVNNRKLRQELGVKLSYPNYRIGLKAALEG